MYKGEGVKGSGRKVPSWPLRDYSCHKHVILVRLVTNSPHLEHHHCEDLTAYRMTTELFCWLHFIGTLYVIFFPHKVKGEGKRKKEVICCSVFYIPSQSLYLSVHVRLYPNICWGLSYFIFFFFQSESQEFKVGDCNCFHIHSPWHLFPSERAALFLTSSHEGQQNLRSSKSQGITHIW